jgi:hypothetical protein
LEYYSYFINYYFESSEGHKFNIAKVSMIILGILLAFFSVILGVTRPPLALKSGRAICYNLLFKIIKGFTLLSLTQHNGATHELLLHLKLVTSNLEPIEI